MDGGGGAVDFLHCNPFRVSKLGTCTIVSVNGTFFEAKMCTKESTHFIFKWITV